MTAPASASSSAGPQCALVTKGRADAAVLRLWLLCVRVATSSRQQRVVVVCVCLVLEGAVCLCLLIFDVLLLVGLGGKQLPTHAEAGRMAVPCLSAGKADAWAACLRRSTTHLFVIFVLALHGSARVFRARRLLSLSFELYLVVLFSTLDCCRRRALSSTHTSLLRPAILRSFRGEGRPRTHLARRA